MERNADSNMSRLCNRLMSSEQSALDTQAYALEEMEYILDQNPDREDIKSCIDEIKKKVKADENEHWIICSRWGEHFDDVAGGEDDDDAKGAEKNKKTDDTDDGE